MIDVTIEMSTQIITMSDTLSINVLPEGSIVHRHTSVLLDLKSRANVLRFMNIIVDATPIIPYEGYRRENVKGCALSFDGKYKQITTHLAALLVLN